MRRILNVNQIQAGGRCSLGRHRAIAPLQHLGYPFARPATVTDRHQGAGNISHHVMQKRIGLNFEYDQITASTDIDKLHVSHRRTRLTGSGAKCAEILLAQQCLCRFVHRRRIERTAMPGQLPLHQCGAYLGIGDDIAVAPRQRRKAGMKVTVNRDCPVDAYRLREAGVTSHHPRFTAAGNRVVEMNDLGVGVNAGIGAPGTLHSQWRTGDLCQRELQLILDSDDTGMRLRLPTVVEAAIVLDTTRYSRANRQWLR